MRMSEFQAAPRELFFSKDDPRDPRWGDVVQSASDIGLAKSMARALWIGGYEDDEGIANNGGRIGARTAPNEIRRFFYKMICPERHIPVCDAGNLKPVKPLAERHEIGRQTARQVLEAGHIWAGLGGGHDYGYAEGQAFLDVFSQTNGKTPVIVNIDAHLDVRPVTDRISSGTPFFRLHEGNRNFELIQIGLQRQCNSLEHIRYAADHNDTTFFLEDIAASGRPLADFVVSRLGDRLVARRPCFLSVDIDAFSSSYAPGASQSWPTGLEPREFFQLMDLLLARWDVRILGIYEVSPPLDVADVTSKLAALILNRFATHQTERADV